MENLKQDKSKSREIFEKLLDQDLAHRKFKESEICSATVTKIGPKYIECDLGLKSESFIAISEFENEEKKIECGDKIDVLLCKIENPAGEVEVSFQRAKQAKSWRKMVEHFRDKKDIVGIAVGKVRGGFAISSNGAMCFLPNSQASNKIQKNYDELFKNQLSYTIEKIDERRKNIVISRRNVLNRALLKVKEKAMKNLKVGSVVTGTVKNIVDWGAFIDIGGVDALLHVTDLSFSRVDKVDDILSIGNTIRVMITKIDPETKHISVSCKALGVDPYIGIEKRFKIGEKYLGEVCKLTQYGAFIRLAEGVEGLCHSSELSWIKKNVNPQEILSNSQKVWVRLIDIKKNERRISLSYRQCIPNPWEEFVKQYKVNDIVKAHVKSVSDFGLFLTIENTGLDSLCHYKSLSWTEKESELSKYRKNMLVTCKILEINVADRKIRTGIRECAGQDPIQFFQGRKVGDIITGKINGTTVNGIYLNFGNNNFSVFIKKNQLAKELENQRPARFVKGDSCDSMITELNLNERKISLSIKALEEKQKAETVKRFGVKDSGGILQDIFDFSRVKTKKPKIKK